MQESERDILPIEPGLVLGGQYEVVKCLGIGRTGTVYLCKATTEPPYYLALKVLSSAFISSKDNPYYARFRNEVAATYRVSHKNVVFTYEYISEPDFVAYTMEYVPGGSLASFLEEHTHLEIPFIIHVLRQLCSGLQAIHDAGIVHRDLKPDNVLLTRNLDAKITDFGIAVTGDGPKLTAKGSVVGTIQYLSPEYLETGTVGPPGDIYALGTIGYELITGRTPFQDKSVFQTIDSKINADPIAPDQVNPECPSALSGIVMKALHRDASKRFSSAREMQASLDRLAEHYLYSPPSLGLPAPIEGTEYESEWVAVPTEIYSVKPTEMLELRPEWRSVRARTYRAAFTGTLLGLIVLLLAVGWESGWNSWNVPDTVHVPLLPSTVAHEKGEGTVDLATIVESEGIERSAGVFDPSPLHGTLGDQVMARYPLPTKETEQGRKDEREQKPKSTQEKVQDPQEQEPRPTPQMLPFAPCPQRDAAPRCIAAGRLDLLINLGRLSSWPSSAFRDSTSPIKLCLVGSDPFGESLDRRLENVSAIGGRKIVVRRLPVNVDSVSMARCHLLYSGEAIKASGNNPLLGLASRTTLTISEEHGGGMIHFKESNSSVRIEVDKGKSRGSEVKLPRLSSEVTVG